MGREGRDYWEEQLSEYWDSGLTWAHVRRYLVEAFDNGYLKVEPLLKHVRNLYQIEHEAKERAEEQLRRNRSAAEYRLNRLALQRAFARLQVKQHNHLSE